ncbi:MAG: VPLPA-CTERM sorting domain-containing protein, partial [Gammaproteobacteria bacterium]|nr:VPLPA-CTERM sorting domain-containing protein [Gammaproteobacteria bacterium]
YTSEGFDVDNIAFDFFNGANLVGSLEIQPDLGTSPGITAQDILLDAPLNVTSVTAFLTGSNGQVDFQNIGFTASVSQVPLPAGVWLLASALAGIGCLRRRRQ